jgi:proteasome lid subunit RPN8/RPN11
VQYQFRISGKIHQRVRTHLLPGDCKEAVGFFLCGQRIDDKTTTLLVREFYPIEYRECERGGDFVRWETEIIVPLLEKANVKSLSVIKIHSHPGGFDQFSDVDNESDNKLFPSIYGWMDGDQPHGSCVLLPSGEIFGRIISSNATHHPISKVSVCGDEIRMWNKTNFNRLISRDVTLRNRQTLGDGTAMLLKSLCVGIVGVSGTGSPVVEQLARLGVGKLILCDPDHVEYKNLNRIINTFVDDADSSRKKVEVIGQAIKKMGFDTEVIMHDKNLYESRQALMDLAACDVLFGCLDSIDGRHLLNQLATFYVIPYFDLGIKIEADGRGGIDQINGVIHYLQPGGSSLITRGCYSMKTLEASALKRKSPDEFLKRVAEKYIVNLPVDRPAVISINMQVAGIAINEFLDRLHRFKNSQPSSRAATWVLITEDSILHEDDGEPDKYLEKKVGIGDTIPFLEMPEL